MAVSSSPWSMEAASWLRIFSRVGAADVVALAQKLVAAAGHMMLVTQLVDSARCWRCRMRARRRRRLPRRRVRCSMERRRFRKASIATSQCCRLADQRTRGAFRRLARRAPARAPS